MLSRLFGFHGLGSGGGGSGSSCSRGGDRLALKAETASGGEGGAGRVVAVTEPPVGIPALQDELDAMMFETFDVQRFFRAPAPLFVALHAAGSSGRSRGSSEPEDAVMMVVDSGYSFTHAVPVVVGRSVCRPRFDGGEASASAASSGASSASSSSLRDATPILGPPARIFGRGVRRLDVGGKLLTNTLKDLLSYRKFDMMEELALVEGAFCGSAVLELTVSIGTVPRF